MYVHFTIAAFFILFCARLLNIKREALSDVGDELRHGFRAVTVMAGAYGIIIVINSSPLLHHDTKQYFFLYRHHFLYDQLQFLLKTLTLPSQSQTNQSNPLQSLINFNNSLNENLNPQFS
ncbi:hypothetical protein QVD17_37029 [Tagetes erecta]|uniref:Uncharacterized protein n=1 Tax=Tagetes erecta TaxID=13708 RepID=A0AAD8NIU2_TARER|nr:hypothetical protein QVD17_37029 [Tagetes erecta]